MFWGVGGGGGSISLLYQNPTPPGDNFFFGHDPDDLSELFLNDDHDDHRYFFSLVFILTIPKITVPFFSFVSIPTFGHENPYFRIFDPDPDDPLYFFC